MQVQTQERTTKRLASERASRAARAKAVPELKLSANATALIEAAQMRGADVRIEWLPDGKPAVTIKEATRRPNGPEKFAFASALDPALHKSWAAEGMAATVIGGRGYVTLNMLKIATGRASRVLDRWAAQGKLAPSQKAGHIRLWAAHDLHILLSEGRFPIGRSADKPGFDASFLRALDYVLQMALGD